MSNVAPDSSTDAPPPDPTQAPSAMETDETNEAVPVVSSGSAATTTAVAAAASSTQQPANFAAALAGSAAVDTSDGDVETLRKRLEARELEITGELNVADYAHLLLIYLVQFRHIDAKYCYQRAFEKHRSDLLKELWKIGAANAKFDYGKALQQCRALTFDAVLQTYITELTNRLTSLQLETIAKCYTSLERELFAELLGIAADSEELARVVATCGWRIDDGWVIPAETEQCRTVAAQLINPAFGEFRRPKKKEQVPASAVSAADVESLKKLVAASDFIDIHATA